MHTFTARSRSVSMAGIAGSVLIAASGCSSSTTEGPAPTAPETTVSSTSTGDTATPGPATESSGASEQGSPVDTPTLPRTGSASSTEIITVLPWEDGSVKTAEMPAVDDVKCFGGALSQREDAVRCTYRAADSSEETSYLSNLCFLEPSEQSRAACPTIGDPGWTVLDPVGELEPISGESVPPEEGDVYRIETAGGVTCMTGSGSGPRTPVGYVAWAGHCMGADGSRLGYWWVPEQAVEGVLPHQVGVAEGGYAQVAYGLQGERPTVAEVVRAYR